MTPDEAPQRATMLDLYLHSNPDRQAARERWPWEVDERRELPWPDVPAITVVA
jgi:hypothetical protein